MSTTTKTMKLPMPADETNRKRAIQFFGAYNCQMMVGPSDKPFFLGEPAPRVCRFCGKTTPEVTFEKDAHVMPDFMGNRNILSYFECDTCNALFAKYEDSFANYLGISRTFSQIKGKRNKVPKFKDNQTGLEVSLNEEGLQIKTIVGQDPFIVDEATNTAELITKQPGYVPIHLLKLLLKMGLSLLEESEVADYEWARQFVTSTRQDEAAKGKEALKVMMHYMPGPPLFMAPFLQLYARKPDGENDFPDKIMVLYYANYYIQVILPFSRAEKARILANNSISIPVFPLLIGPHRQEEFGEASFRSFDFTSAEKVKGKEQRFSFTFEKMEKIPLDNPAETTEPAPPSKS